MTVERRRRRRIGEAAGPAVADPQMQAYARMVAERARLYPDPLSLPLPEMREVIEAINVPLGEGGPVLALSADRWAPVHGRYMLVRVHEPAPPSPGPGRPAVVYFHGSGWTWNSVYTHDRVMREYAARAGLVVLGPNYALAPEAKFPRPLDECVALLRWLRRRGGDWGIDTDRILVGGDSAGANLALAALMALRDAGEDFVRGAVLSYGVYDSDFSRPSFGLYGSGRELLSLERMRFYWDNYITGPQDMHDPRAVPLRGELGGLPPLMLQIAEMDVLHDENVALSRRLDAAGVAHEAWVYPGLFHSFLRACPFVDLAMDAIAEGAEWLARQAAGPGSAGSA